MTHGFPIIRVDSADIVVIRQNTALAEVGDLLRGKGAKFHEVSAEVILGLFHVFRGVLLINGEAVAGNATHLGVALVARKMHLFQQECCQVFMLIIRAC